MVLKEYADWEKKYVKGVNGLLLFIPCASIYYISKEFYEKFMPRNDHNVNDWVEDISCVKKLVDNDIENVMGCIAHIQPKYPNATFNSGFYGIEIAGLNDDEIVACISPDTLRFGIYVIDIKSPKTSSRKTKSTKAKRKSSKIPNND